MHEQKLHQTKQSKTKGSIRNTRHNIYFKNKCKPTTNTGWTNRRETKTEQQQKNAQEGQKKQQR